MTKAALGDHLSKVFKLACRENGSATVHYDESKVTASPPLCPTHRHWVARLEQRHAEALQAGG